VPDWSRPVPGTRRGLGAPDDRQQGSGGKKAIGEPDAATRGSAQLRRVGPCIIRLRNRIRQKLGLIETRVHTVRDISYFSTHCCRMANS
jgi:hypothetical protein